MSLVSRRRFLAAATGACGLAALGGLGWYASARTGRSLVGVPVGNSAEGLRLVRQTGCALGAAVTITALHRHEAVGRKAVAAAFAELDLVERVMSLYRPDSELCRLNRAGSLDHPHPYLVDVLQQARTIAEQSGGAFDVTVQPLWDVYAAARRDSRMPSEAEVAAACRKVDWRRVQVSADAIRLSGEGTAVTLNGIAQGFAADRVMARLRECGIEHALVNTGEVGSLGHKVTGEPWCAGIQHPRQADAYAGLVRLDGRFLSTSGDYATTFSDDFTRHHIFEPATGRSPQALASVTVVAPTGMLADALSTAVFVLGVEKGMDLVRETPGADALLVLKEDTRIATDNFPAVS